MSLDLRARGLAARLYRRSARALQPMLPDDSEDQNVAAFESLQDDAFRSQGWRGLLRVWAAESAAVLRLTCSRGRRRGTSRGAMMASFRHDVRDAWRALRHSPSYTAVVVAILAFGIGANTAIFSVVDALLLRSLPYHEPDRLVRAAEWPKTGGNFTVAPAAFLYWQDAAAPFLRLEARRGRRYVVQDDGTPRDVAGATVTSGYFDVLGASAEVGRVFGPGDDAPDAPCRAVVSHRFWRERLGGQPDAVGSAVGLSGEPCRVTGVLPADSIFDRLSAEIYTPLVFTPRMAANQGRSLTVVGRLAPEVTLDQARERLMAIALAFNATRGEAGEGWSSAITPWRDVVVRVDTRRLAWILFGAVGLVLAIACANVAGLSLSRAMARRHELAIRAALGAGRWRLVRHLTIETTLLGAMGGMAGLAIGSWTLRAFTTLMPAGLLPPEAAVGLDARALLFTAAVAIGTGLLVGTLPAWQAARSVAAGAALVSGSRTQSGSRSTSRLHAALVVAEVALAMVLVTGAVLLAVSFVRLGRVDPGFDPERVLTLQLAPPPARYSTRAEAGRVIGLALDRIRAVPGVEQAGAVTSLPLGGWLYGARFRVEGRPDDPERPTYAHIQRATDGYFETLGIPMTRGRAFTPADDARAPLAAIVNETFAARYLDGRRPVGARIDLDIEAAGRPDGSPWEIVGVVRDVKTGGLADEALATPEIYVPQRQSPFTPVFVAVRARAGDPAALEPRVREALLEIDAQMPANDVRTMEDWLGLSVRAERFRTTMISAFAVLACVLAGFGVYSVRARAVAARRREMGIRLALGATRAEVLRLVVGQGLALAAAGVVLGLAGAAYSAYLVEQWLFDTRLADPAMLSAAVALVAIPVVAASWLAARRAASVSPAETLRGE